MAEPQLAEEKNAKHNESERNERMRIQEIPQPLGVFTIITFENPKAKPYCTFPFVRERNLREALELDNTLGGTLKRYYR